jgi:hypothetical protein
MDTAKAVRTEEQPCCAGERAPWVTPLLSRLQAGEAEGGDSIAGDGGALS